MKSSVALEISQSHISLILEQRLDSDFVAQDTSQHKRGSFFKESPSIDINIFFNQLRNDFGSSVGTTDRSQMNTVFALRCGYCSGINRVLAVTFENLSDSLDVALIAGL